MSEKKPKAASEMSSYEKQTALINSLVMGKCLEVAMNELELNRLAVARWISRRDFALRLRRARSRVRLMHQIDSDFSVKPSRAATAKRAKKTKASPCRLHENVTPQRAKELRAIRKHAVI